MESNEENTFLNCDICQIAFTGVEPYVQHLKGKKHRKCLNRKTWLKRKNCLLGPEVDQSSEGNDYHCNFCGETLPDIIAYNEHLLTVGHLERVRESNVGKKKLKKNPSELQCELCLKVFNNIGSQQQHFRSRRHEKALKKAEITAKLSNCVKKPSGSEDINSGDIGSIRLKKLDSNDKC